MQVPLGRCGEAGDRNVCTDTVTGRQGQDGGGTASEGHLTCPDGCRFEMFSNDEQNKSPEAVAVAGAWWPDRELREEGGSRCRVHHRDRLARAPSLVRPATPKRDLVFGI